MGKKTDLRPVPKGLAAAVAKAAKHIDKRYVYGLPHYGLNAKLRIDLVELGDMDVFEEHEVDVEAHPHWLRELAKQLAGMSGVRIEHLPR